MKTFFRLCLLATFSIVVSSCTKTNFDQTTNNTAQPPIPTPVIEAKIYRFINQPFETRLGTAEAIFHEGDNVVIYIPYLVTNDKLQNASISMINDAKGLEIAKFDLLPSTDPSADQLKVPQEIKDLPFMFVTFTADNNFTDKTISLITTFTGNLTTTTDAIPAAFSVVP